MRAREALGDKCLLIAEHTLGDQLCMPSQSPSQPQQENMAEQNGIGGKDPSVPSPSFLSCGTLSPRDKTLSGLFAEAGRLRGEFKLCGRVIE